MSSEYGPGIRRMRSKWQVFARVHGQFVSESHPLETPLVRLQAHLAALKAREKNAPRHLSPEVQPARGRMRTFADDAAEYLSLIHLASKQDQAYHIAQWVTRFGPRVRSTITSREIRHELETWRRNGRADGDGGLKVASLNRRRTALMAMYTGLDGKSAVNIVKDVPPYDERGNIQIRALPMLAIGWIIRHTTPRSKTRARLRVLQWTGWPAKLVMEIERGDVDWQAGLIRAHRRKKGKGMPEQWVPVLEEALVAVRRLFALDAEGPFSTSGMYKSFQVAVHKENARRRRRNLPTLPHINPYAIRHSFGTWAAPLVNDDRILKEMMRTNSIARYTHGASTERMGSARARMQEERRAHRAQRARNFAQLSPRTPVGTQLRKKVARADEPDEPVAVSD